MITVNEDLCRGCGLCVNACPRGAITMVAGKAKISQDLCNECMSCVGVCPNRAIASSSTDSLRDTAEMLARIDGQLQRIRAQLAHLERR